MKYNINIENSDEFKVSYTVEDVEYFLEAKNESKDYPESLRYGWLLYFGKKDTNPMNQFTLTKLNTPISVLTGLGLVYALFESKYNPKKISFITNERLRDIFKEQFFSKYEVFENGIEINDVLDLHDKESIFYTLYK